MSILISSASSAPMTCCAICTVSETISPCRGEGKRIAFGNRARSGRDAGPGHCQCDGLVAAVPHVVLAVGIVGLHVVDNQGSFVETETEAERRIEQRPIHVGFLVLIAFDAGDDAVNE